MKEFEVVEDNSNRLKEEMEVMVKKKEMVVVDKEAYEMDNVMMVMMVVYKQGRVDQIHLMVWMMMVVEESNESLVVELLIIQEKYETIDQVADE